MCFFKMLPFRAQMELCGQIFVGCWNFGKSELDLYEESVRNVERPNTSTRYTSSLSHFYKGLYIHFYHFFTFTLLFYKGLYVHFHHFFTFKF